MKKVIVSVVTMILISLFALVCVGCGEEGNNGAKWIVKDTAPTTSDTANVGDLWLDGSVSDVYLYSEAGWKKLGSVEQEGSTWHTGSNAPGNGTGKVGDFYIDKTNLVIYEKTADGWVEVCEFKGEDNIVTITGDANEGNNA